MAKVMIGLDAGHGGDSSGTYSIDTAKDGLFEKDYCLELVKMIGDRLLFNGFGVFYTRTTDVNPGTVIERAKACINARCRYAVSIHFNGFGSESANGTEVFVPYAEKGAGIETGFYNELSKFFKIRAPFARSNNFSNRNDVFDKKLNIATRKFDAVSANKDYFGFIRTAWANGLSADLLEVCFLTNRKDFDAYIKNKEAIADGIAKSIVEGYGEKYVSLEPDIQDKKLYIPAFNDRKKAEEYISKIPGAVLIESE